jgi:hypothetical protein
MEVCMAVDTSSHAALVLLVSGAVALLMAGGSAISVRSAVSLLLVSVRCQRVIGDGAPDDLSDFSYEFAGDQRVELWIFIRIKCLKIFSLPLFTYYGADR